MFARPCYAGCRLDRAAESRRDEGWLADRQADPTSRVVPLWRDRSLFVAGDPPRALAVAPSAVTNPGAGSDGIVFLGRDGGDSAWFAADVSNWEQDRLGRLAAGVELADLRRMGPVMDADEAALLAYARGILYWHRRHRFCGVCGHPTQSRDGGHLRVCLNEACRAEHFPRTDPAVIMLVTRPGADGGACLLARQPRWPRGMYSTLAGFVEPGESLEEAVAREVREETGIEVAAVRYRGSQPWPFPSSLMLGFRAETGEAAAITVLRDELEDAMWFTRADIGRFDGTARRLPRIDSIARLLVEEWLTEAGA